MIRQARIRFLVAGAAISSVSLLLRALRWRVLLQSQARVGIADVFWATSAGYFGNNILPARAGELVRTFIISSRSSLGSAFVLTTALAERTSDAITLVLISAVALLGLSNPPGWLAGVVRPFTIAALCAVAVIAFAPFFEGVGRRGLAVFPMPEGVRAKASGALAQTAQGLRAFHDLSRFLTFAGLTALIWFLDATAAVISARGLNLRFSYDTAFLLIAGLGLGSALPSTPGYVGIYQFVAVSVLAPFGFTRTEAIAYILVAQAFSYLTIGFWGMLGLWQTGGKRLKSSTERTKFFHAEETRKLRLLLTPFSRDRQTQ